MIDNNSIMLIPEGLSDTMHIETFSTEFDKIRELGEDRIKVYIQALENQITQINCSDKECKSKTDDNGFVSKVNKKNRFIETSILPNPFRDLLTVKVATDYPEVFSIDIVSILGQPILRKTMNNNELSIDTRDWAPGVYICTISSKGEALDTHKIVKN